jgi:hypothetical protein
MAGLITALATVASLSAQNKAAAAQSKAIEEQKKADRARYRREQRQAIRRAQIARASAIASAQGAGADTGSGAAGGIGSVTSQLGSGLGFASQVSAINSNISGFQQQAIKYDAQSKLFGSIAKISSDISAKAGGQQSESPGSLIG